MGRPSPVGHRLLSPIYLSARLALTVQFCMSVTVIHGASGVILGVAKGGTCPLKFVQEDKNIASPPLPHHANNTNV